MRKGFQKLSDEGLVTFHLKPSEKSPRSRVGDDREKVDRPCCRPHQCPDWVPCRRVHPRGFWERWEKSGKNYNELRRMYIAHTHLNLTFHLKSIAFQFHEKPETCIGTARGRVPVSVKCMDFLFTITCYGGVNIHEPVRRFDIADTDGKPHPGGVGRKSLIVG